MTERDVLEAIRAMPLAVDAIETAAAAVDRHLGMEALDLLTTTAQVVVDEHPELEVGPHTVAAIMAVVVRGMVAQRGVRLD